MQYCNYTFIPNTEWLKPNTFIIAGILMQNLSVLHISYRTYYH